MHRKWTEDEISLLTHLIGNQAYRSKSGKFKARLVVAQFPHHSLAQIHQRTYILRHPGVRNEQYKKHKTQDNFAMYIDQAMVALTKANATHEHQIKEIQCSLAYYKELAIRVAKVVETMK